MSLKLFNTLTGKNEVLIPGGGSEKPVDQYPAVTIYSCGPTVYSYAHIGNFRTFIFNDLLRRYLKFRGFSVDHTMNITDVDDKTITGARQENISLREYTERYTQIFFDDMKTLNIENVEHYPRATESIDAMIDIINHLFKKGFAYKKDGSVYFSISKYTKYGALSRLDSREIKSGLRYDTDEYEKDDVRDFALWKSAAPEEPSWDTPFGPGRPGWHIECSAMVRDVYKKTIDIHTGGVDLIFPHHENEIAQSEAAYDEPFVRYWIHAEHLLVDGSKMSKSKGNFYTLRDLLSKGHSPRAIRYLLISSHYRKQLNFTMAGLQQAESALSRIDNLIVRLEEIKGGDSENPQVGTAVDELMTRFVEEMDNDLNIAGALGKLFEFITLANSFIDNNSLAEADVGVILDTLRRLDSVLGLIFFQVEKDEIDTGRIEDLITERNNARKEKNFARADEIRDMLILEGILLEDTKDGTRWKRKK